MKKVDALRSDEDKEIEKLDQLSKEIRNKQDSFRKKVEHAEIVKMVKKRCERRKKEGTATLVLVTFESGRGQTQLKQLKKQTTPGFADNKSKIFRDLWVTQTPFSCDTH